MIISKEEFEQYTDNYPDDDVLIDVYIDSAVNIIVDYLGYDPIKQSHTELYSGDGSIELELKNTKIHSIEVLAISGEEKTEFVIDDNRLVLTNGDKFIQGTKNILVQYTGGYEPIPGIIKMTALRIAALLSTESDGNIGITSKTFQDSGSRTFVNTTNFNKYLAPIESYKLKRWQ
jgi:hypothetical protein